MNPQEKAQELFDKYWALIAYKIEGSVGRLVIKQCALIAVDEILNDYKNYLLHENTEYKGLMYWNEVKQEIEKL
jgi:hypothetical protein